MPRDTQNAPLVPHKLTNALRQEEGTGCKQDRERRCKPVADKRGAHLDHVIDLVFHGTNLWKGVQHTRGLGCVEELQRVWRGGL